MVRDQRELEQELDGLLAAYRGACEAPEASANFMPQLWARIDARQSSSWFLKRWTEGFVAAAAAACLMVFLLQVVPEDVHSAVYHSTYLEALAQEKTPENSILLDVAAVAYPDQYSADSATK
ncbi:MAG TPA: hypothetical protein PKJ41_11090 [Bryobacteraceae bacterium]|nr:hypothetical protein [Bryobacteraceae bacterium]HPT26027.1 hypothetical protein [Bryobacteraceae bacterium]